MRIVIDLQGAQTSSRFRGIGRYSLSLALAITRNAPHHEIWLVLNAAFPQSILNIRKAFNGLIPKDQIRVFEVPTPISECDISNTSKARAAEQIREYFLEQLNPDIVLLTSLFEGYIDDAATSVGRFSTTKTAVILYDLIPYLAPKKYLPTQSQQEYYARKIDSLKKADLLLCISEATKQEGMKVLHVAEDKMVNISAAVDKSFHPIKPSQEQIQNLSQKYSITRKIVMYAPGGFDERKNIDGLIKAYAMLPQALRETHQLVIASKIGEEEKAKLLTIAAQAKLRKDELIITDYILDEELIVLYNLATLFVFPSKHEGFGLPALEAMSCGAPTIGSNTTSIPEVIGWDEALFDSNSFAAISKKMQQALEDEEFSKQLKQHAIEQSQKFSWDESAKVAISFLEKNVNTETSITQPQNRPKLAYFSPLPPHQTGISGYSVELLEELSNYYDIELIVPNKNEIDQKIALTYTIQTVEHFLRYRKNYMRVLYHFGNSTFHSHMFELLQKASGVVVLHDFYLSHILEYMAQGNPSTLTQLLYTSHGYKAAQEFAKSSHKSETLWKYPCNLPLLQDALGVIVHSKHSKELAQKFYSKNSANDWRIIPLLRKAPPQGDKLTAREKLFISKDAFVICTFGLIEPNKLSDKLLDAWIDSTLSKNKNSILIFVGKMHTGDYGTRLTSKMKQYISQKDIIITDWVSDDDFKNYLLAADVGVQLRTSSRGETSAAILDSLNYGLATITNAHGSLSELPKDAVLMLEDNFKTSDLTEALESLFNDTQKRTILAQNAQKLISQKHDPKICAKHYAKAIEDFYEKERFGYSSLLSSLSDSKDLHDNELAELAKAIAISTSPKIKQRQILVDISSIVYVDLKTGIQRVVRSQLIELIRNVSSDFRIEPIYFSPIQNEPLYRYARKYTAALLGLEHLDIEDEPIDISHGDIFYGLDLCADEVMKNIQNGLYERYKAIGVEMVFLVYDLLPISNPDFFPSYVEKTHTKWLQNITHIADKLICISDTVAQELAKWIQTHKPQKLYDIEIIPIHLGADIEISSIENEITEQEKEMLLRLSSTTTFLMVGTIEPRKGHAQVLKAFEILRKQAEEVTLVIVGKKGWMVEETIDTLQKLQDNIHLFWLEGISDTLLEKVYAASTCLIAASEGEGFGLPLIEAAQHALPIIARDISVFREVSGEHAYYFPNDNDPNALAQAIEEWLKLYAASTHPTSDTLPWLTWKQNAQKLLGVFNQCSQN
jgi:glycosyltransferase involved in cell wall biosynthesis